MKLISQNLSNVDFSTDYYSFYKISKRKYDSYEKPERIELVTNFKCLIKNDLKKDIEISLLVEFLN